MASAPRRVQNPEKRKISKPYAAVLEALNADRTYEVPWEEISPRRLGLLVLRLQQLEAALQTDRFVMGRKYDPYRQNPAIARPMVKIDRLLSRYHVTPMLQPLYNEGKASLAWHLSYYDVESQAALDEFACVQRLVGLAERKKISYLRRCLQCRSWLYASFAHQRFCSADCKEHFHKTNPADKARRREWARNNYAIQKHKNVK